MPLRSARHLIFALTCVPLVSVALSQSLTKSHVTFTVVDPSGAAIPGARVKISASSSLIAAAEAGPNGAVSFDLPTGSYELSATSRGFLLTKQTVSVGGSGKQVVVLLLPARQDRQDQMWIDSPVNHLELGVPSLNDIWVEPIESQGWSI
jgi:Carboxypeptidase regulatory-like domain